MLTARTIAAAIALGTASLQTTAPATVPGVMLLKANTSPIDFVAILTEAGVPAGVELPDGTGRPDLTPAVDLASQPPVPTEQVVGAFNRSHPDQHASVNDGVVVIRSFRSPAETLESVIELQAETFPTIDLGLKAILARLDPTLKGGGGGMLSLMVPSGKDGRPLYALSDLGPVSLRAGRTTVVDALNALIKQVPHHAWVVQTRSAGSASIIESVGLLRRRSEPTMVQFKDPALERASPRR